MQIRAREPGLQSGQELVEAVAVELYLELLPALPSADLLGDAQVIMPSAVSVYGGTGEPDAVSLRQQPVDELTLERRRTRESAHAVASLSAPNRS